MGHSVDLIQAGLHMNSGLVASQLIKSVWQHG
jgi:hypothetical protein